MANKVNSNVATLSAVIANTALTAVNTARLNECRALTTNETSINMIEQFAKLDTFDSKYQINRCKVLSELRTQLVKVDKVLSFRKLCEVFEIDNSNAEKMATIWEKFYSRKPELYNAYSIGQLSPFVKKHISDVDRLFESDEMNTSITVKQCRELAKCISADGIIDTGKILDIFNGESGDVTTKKSKTTTETETETTTNAETETKTDTLPTLSIGDKVVIEGRIFEVIRKDDGEITISFVEPFEE